MTQLSCFSTFRSLHPTLTMILSRAVAFIIFAFVIFNWGYVPAYRDGKFFIFMEMLDNTVRAANDGHPLMTYDTVDTDKLIKLTEISGGYYDMGWPTLISMAVSIDKVIYGPTYQDNPRIAYKVVLIFNLITALLFLLPVVPFFVSVGGLFALAVSVTVLPFPHNAFGNFWGATYGVIVLSVLIGTIGLKSGKSGRSVVLFGILAGLMMGVAQFIRNESVVTSLVTTSVMLAGVWLLVLFYRRKLKDDDPAWKSILRSSRYATLTLVLYMAIIYAMPVVVRGIYALTFQQSYSDTKLAMHADGHSLYMSLGFVSNPYNISWRDNVPMVHSEVIRPGTSIESPNYMSTLRDEWLRIIVSDPKLLASNMAAKFVNAIQLIYAMSPTNIFLVIFPFGLLFSVILVFRQPNFSRVFIFIAFLGLVAISLFVPLFIHPFYSQSFQGVLLTSVSVLPIALWLAGHNQYELDGDTALVDKPVAIRYFGLIFALVIVGSAGVVAFIAIQSMKQDALLKDSLALDPYQQIQSEEYRYDSIFNQLSVSDQENVIAKLKAQKDSNILVPKADNEPSPYTFFRPEVIILSKEQVHLISWYGVPDANFDHNELLYASGFVRVCANCDPMPTLLKNNPYALTKDNTDTTVLAANDTDWSDHYRMISLPLSNPIPANPKWCAALQTIVTLELQVATFHLRTYPQVCFQENT